MAHADWADVRVGLSAIRVGAIAKRLGLRQKLHVRLNANNGFEFHLQWRGDSEPSAYHFLMPCTAMGRPRCVWLNCIAKNWSEVRIVQTHSVENHASTHIRVLACAGGCIDYWRC